MATDLFSKYFSNPDKQYLFTNMICSGAASGDKFFAIKNNSGVIVDGANTLASIDLSSLSEVLTDWKREQYTIEPYDFVFVKGFSKGRTYQRNVFTFIPDQLIDNEDFEYISGIEFNIDYYRNGYTKRTHVYAHGSIDNDESFIDATQEVLDNNRIPVTISVDGNLIVFTGEQTGYEFHIGIDEHPNAIRMFSTDVEGVTEPEEPIGVNELLYDYCPQYIPPFKYRNGAFKGVLIKPNYPMYNADSIPDEMKGLKLAFMPDRVDMLLPVKIGQKMLYDKRSFDVLGDYTDLIEKQQFEHWRNVDETRPCPNEKYEKSLLNRNVIGLYGFVDWVYEHNQWAWLNTGSLYINLAATDTPDTATKNLIPSFVVYNPNPFPVQIDCLLYA